MKYWSMILLLVLLCAGSVSALEIAGVQIEPTATIGDRTLKLNGSGVRKKFFVKVYIGSLYAEHRLASSREVLQDRGDKLIRMKFLHSKVGREKITEAFSEGLTNNAPDVAGSVDARKFLSFFTDDFVKGDTVDLALGSDGTIVVRHNNKLLRTLQSPKLVHGILAIYFGEKPADVGLKKGMLGKE